MLNVRFALRMLLKSPFLTAIAVASLGLGIGANAAIFSLFNQFLLRPLPVADPRTLVNLSAPGPKPGSQSCNDAGDCDGVFSYPMFRDLERAQTVFTGIAAHRLFGANLAYKGQTLSGEGMLVSGSYFPLLGIRPALGRLLTPEDDRAIGESHVVVLGHAYWQTRFGQDPTVLNDTMIVNGQSLTIVGVAPEDFSGTTMGHRPEVYVPITLRGFMSPGFNGFDNRRSYWAYLFARLKPGTTIDQARTALNVQYKQIVNDVEAPLQRGLSDQMLAQFRAKDIALGAGARGQSSIDREARAPLTLLLAVTGLVLLIACANIANLLLARAAGRASEMAVRLSIGASRWQLVAQLLTESFLLALFGGLAGLVATQWTLDLIGALIPHDTAAILMPAINPAVLLFAAALTLATGILFGLFPALHSTRPDLVTTLKGQAGQPGGARSAARFRTTLATVQIALSMALLVAAGLFTKSLLNVARVELGINVEHLITFGVSPELNGYKPQRSRVLFQRMEDELRGLPGVTSVTASLVPAIAGSNWGTDIAVEGFKTGPDVDTNARFNEVGAQYFHTMGIRLIAGREFTPADTLASPKVAIVNQAFAKKFNLGSGAVGKRIGANEKNQLDTEIVGLVQDAKYSGVKQQIQPLFFTPYMQDESLGQATFYVRTGVDPAQLLQTLPKVVARLDPALPVENLRLMTEQVRNNVFLDRFVTVLSAAFAVLATLLAAIGLYGVLAYTVAQRTREIGLRMALGAAPSRVRAMVLRQVAIMTLVGGIIGLTAAIWLGRASESLLYEMKGSDPTVLATAAMLLTLVALGAGLIPAHRASRVDPMRALRYE
jgi:putative ABC transport system permease protein